jgi:hypothetical protein
VAHQQGVARQQGMVRRHGVARQQGGERCGGLAGRHVADDTGNELRVLPPLQAGGRGAEIDAVQAAAERDDGAGQRGPVGVARADAAAEAHPGDGGAERAANGGGFLLGRAGREIGAHLAQQVVAPSRATGVDEQPDGQPEHEAHQPGEETGGRLGR